MRGLARIAQDLGDGDIRLTVWQKSFDLRRVRNENVALAIAGDRETRPCGPGVTNTRRG